MEDAESPSRTVILTMFPIGSIHTPFQHSEGTPIQSAVADGDLAGFEDNDDSELRI